MDKLDNVVNEINIDRNGQKIIIKVDISDGSLIQENKLTPYAKKQLCECFGHIDRDIKNLISNLYIANRSKEIEQDKIIGCMAEFLMEYNPKIKRVIREKSVSGNISYYGAYIALAVYAIEKGKSSEIGLLRQDGHNVLING